MKRIIPLLLGLLLLTTGTMAANNPSGLPTVTSIAGLRLIPATQYQSVYVTQFNSTTGIGGGEFYTTGATCTDDGGVFIKGSDNKCWKRNTNNQPYNVSWFGAQCAGVQILDGVSTSSSHTVTSVSNKWTSGMVGWVAVVNKAASSSNQLVTTVSGYNSAGSLTLTAAAGASGTAETISLYPDDTTAISNTVLAANRDNASMSFPSSQTCGVSNPGTASFWNLTFPSLYLNGATIWLGQTGPTSDTGWGFNMEGVNTSGSQWSGVSVVGPGTVDGLYQTNQGVRQLSLVDAFVWNDGGGTTINNASVIGQITIQNTKGTAINATGNNNFTISNLLVQNCGDYSFQNSGTPGDMTGRPMCITIETPSGDLNISNLVANNAAQAGLLIQNNGSGGPASFHAQISGCSFFGNGYYGLDLEQVSGAIDVTNCRQVGNGIAPSGVLISGGYVARDIAYLRMTNIESYLTDSNAMSIQSIDGASNQTDWSFANIDITGTANHAGQMYLAFGATGVPQRIAIENMNYDILTVAPTGSPTCVTNLTQFQVLKFHNIHASGNLGPTYSTIFNPQAAATGTLYILGSDSSLGAVSVASLGGTNNKWAYWDDFRVQMNGVPTFSGGVTANTYAGTTWTNPLTALPPCP